MTTRVQLELGDIALKRLKDIKDITEAGSYAEVIKQSLAIYERMIRISQGGGTITLTDKSGDTKQLEVIY